MSESARPEPCPLPEPPDWDRIQQILQFVWSRERNAETWLVGGCVRDWLLQRGTNDLDLVVPRDAVLLARALADAFASDFFVLDQERDVARAIVLDSEGRILNVDVARLRAAELLADLSLRDFTVNAMAVCLDQPLSFGPMPPEERFIANLIDPFGGRADLDHGQIRAVTEGAFLDDPLRMLRAVRQAAELGFRIEDATYNLIRRDASLLTTVASERVRDELDRILLLSSGGGWRHLPVLQDTGLLLQVLPEAAALVGIMQSPPHHEDVFDHTRSVLAHLEGLFSLIWPAAGWHVPQSAPGDSLPIADAGAWSDLAAVLRPYLGDLRAYLCEPVSARRIRRDCLPWAALAHDWGKPAMCSVDEKGKTRFLEHDTWGAMLVQARLRVLRMSAHEIGYISRLVSLHMRLGYLAHTYPPSRRAVYRFFREAAGAGPDCVLLSLADYAAIRAGNTRLEPWARRLETAGLLLKTYFRERAERVAPPPLIDGRRIMSTFGLAPGPQIGALLEGLREAQAAGEVANSDEALAWLARRVY
jgi:tRNA nucleotidyltransferase/poly(A) polymerase